MRKSRPLTSNTTKTYKRRPASSNPTGARIRPMTANMSYRDRWRRNGPKRKIDLKEDMRKKRNKEKYEDKLIQIAIKKIQNEKAYDVLIKMGEANEICQLLKLDTTYRVYPSADGTIKCLMVKNNERKETFTLSKFEKEYKDLKKMYYKQLNLEKWELLHDLAVNKNKTILTTKKLNQDNDKDKQPLDKKERLENLKNVLKETMNLTKTLKSQLGILRKKGINSTIINNDKKKL